MMINILGFCRRKLQTVPIATIFCRPYIKVSEKMELLLKQIDCIPRTSQLIYRYPGYRKARIMYYSVNFCTISSVGIASYAWYMEKDKIVEDKLPKFLVNPMQTFFICFTMVLVALLAWTVRHRSPMRIYFQPGSNMYRAIFIGKFPFTTEFHEFKKGSMSYVSLNSYFPWRSSLFQANGRKMLMYDDYFRTAADLHNMFQSKYK